MQALRDDVTSGEVEPGEPLGVGLFLGPTAAADLTGPIVDAFRARHPEVPLSVRPLPLDDPWGREHPDLDVLLYRDHGDGQDDTTTLFQEPRCVVTRPGSELAEAGPSIALADLAGQAIANVRLKDSPAFSEFYTLLDHLDDDAVDRRLLDVADYGKHLADAVAGEYQITTAGSAVRLTAPGHGGAVLAIADAAPSTVTVAVRRPSTAAYAFRQTAADVTRALRPLVPEALPQTVPLTTHAGQAGRAGPGSPRAHAARRT